MNTSGTYAAFAGWNQIVSGPLPQMLRAVKTYMDSPAADHAMPLIFHEESGRQIDFDLRGSVEQVIARATPEAQPAGPGRPRLGVTSREVSLLPRHWEWLEAQAGGASATLRRLIEDARKRNPGEAEMRAAIDATGRFMTALAGNLPDFEEAYRALYARDRARLERIVQDWPADVRRYVLGHVPASFAN